jgi:hypothetical protein
MAGANGQPGVGNAGSAEERVSTAALLAAMELICGMSDHPAATPADQLLDDIQQAEIGPEELTPAFAILLYGFLQVCNDADVDMVVGWVPVGGGGCRWARADGHPNGCAEGCRSG